MVTTLSGYIVPNRRSYDLINTSTWVHLNDSTSSRCSRTPLMRPAICEVVDVTAFPRLRTCAPHPYPTWLLLIQQVPWGVRLRDFRVFIYPDSTEGHMKNETQ